MTSDESTVNVAPNPAAGNNTITVSVRIDKKLAKLVWLKQIAFCFLLQHQKVFQKQEPVLFKNLKNGVKNIALHINVKFDNDRNHTRNDFKT